MGAGFKLALSSDKVKMVTKSISLFIPKHLGAEVQHLILVLLHSLYCGVTQKLGMLKKKCNASGGNF